MTEKEWLSMGYANNLIDRSSGCCGYSFFNVYMIWFKSKIGKIKPQSLDRIEVTYRKYYADSSFSLMLIDDIDEAAIIKFLQSVMVNYVVNDKEFSRLFQIVNNVLTYAHDMEIGNYPVIDWGKIKRLCYSVTNSRKHKKEFIISKSDRNMFFDYVFNKSYSEKQSACYLLAMNFYLGLRVGELAALKWEDFDFSNQCVYIRRTSIKAYNRDVDGYRLDKINYHVQDELKTVNSYRVLPLLPEVAYIYTMLRDWHNHCHYSSDFLCYDGSDTIPVRSLSRTLDHICHALNLQHINSHLIRKTYASVLANSGLPTKVISDLLGHSDIKTTQSYYILDYKQPYQVYREQIKKALNDIQDLNHN